MMGNPDKACIKAARPGARLPRISTAYIRQRSMQGKAARAAHESFISYMPAADSLILSTTI